MTSLATFVESCFRASSVLAGFGANTSYEISALAAYTGDSFDWALGPSRPPSGLVTVAPVFASVAAFCYSLYKPSDLTVHETLGR